MRPLLWLLAPFLLISCKEKKPNIPFTAENSIAVSTPEATHTNDYYQFKIEGLSQQWKLLDAKEITSVIPDASAGGVSTNGVYTAIIVEPLEDVELEAYSRLIHSNMTTALGSSAEFEVENTTTSGQPSQRFSIDAVINEVAFHYECITILYKGFAYQLLTWFSPAQVPASKADITGFTKCFSFLDGQPTLPPITALPDSESVGSRMINGRFESGLHKFAVNPSENWRVLHGVALSTMSADAEVALEAPHQSYYITIEATHLGSRQPSRISEALRATVEENSATITTETLTINGTPTTFHRYVDTADIPTTYYAGIYIHDGTVLHIDAWHLGTNEEALASIQEGLAGIEILTTAQADKISSDLAASPYSPSAVGSNYALRGGTYRNFDENYLWKQPHHLWRVEAGDAALARNPDSSLYAVDLQSNLTMQIITEPAADFTPATFHDLIMESLAGDDPGSQLKPLPDLELPDLTFQQSTVTFADGFDPTTYHILTAVTAEIAIQLIFWASPEIMTANQPALTAAIKGFSSPSPSLTTTKNTPTQYTDFRLGWKLRHPGAGWSHKSLPLAYGSFGSFEQFSNGNKFAQVLAIHLDRTADADMFIESVINERLQVNFDRSSSKGTSKSKGTFAGQDATLISATNQGVKLRIATFVSNQTLWMLTAGSERDSTADSIFKDLEKGFSLLP